jgi:hypothetical protein
MGRLRPALYQPELVEGSRLSRAAWLRLHRRAGTIPRGADDSMARAAASLSRPYAFSPSPGTPGEGAGGGLQCSTVLLLDCSTPLAQRGVIRSHGAPGIDRPSTFYFPLSTLSRSVARPRAGPRGSHLSPDFPAASTHASPPPGNARLNRVSFLLSTFYFLAQRLSPFSRSTFSRSAG